MYMASRFDPNKNSTNLKAHKLSLAFGDQIFEDGNHLIIPSIRPEDREERFKVVGVVDQSYSLACSRGGTSCPFHICQKE